jgi:hypothetical protein
MAYDSFIICILAQIFVSITKPKMVEMGGVCSKHERREIRFERKLKEKSHYQDLRGHRTRYNVCLRTVKDRCGLDSSGSR